MTAQSLGVTVTSEQTLLTTVTVTCTLNGQSGTASAQVYQAVNNVSYSDVTVTTFTYAGIPASGGSVSPSLSYSQTATYSSGSTRSITSGGTVSYSGTSVNTTSGAVSAASKGTAISNTTTVTTATVSVSLNGKSGSKSAVVQQAGNYVTDLSIEASSLLYESISAGSTSATPTLSGDSITFTYSSGSTSGDVPGNAFGTLTTTRKYSLGSVVNGFTAVNSETGVLTATSRGTTIGPARTSGVVTYTVTRTWTPTSGYNAAGVQTDTDSKTATCTQALNTVESGEIVAAYTLGTPVTEFPASYSSNGYSCVWTFSSGSKRDGVEYDSYCSWRVSGDGFTVRAPGSAANYYYFVLRHLEDCCRCGTFGCFDKHDSGYDKWGISK